MAGAAPQPKHRQSNSHIVALLSLKILLLPFFILLNALATFQEERSSAAVDSVRDAFKGLLPVGRRGAAEPGGVGPFDGRTDEGSVGKGGVSPVNCGWPRQIQQQKAQ